MCPGSPRPVQQARVMEPRRATVQANVLSCLSPSMRGFFFEPRDVVAKHCDRNVESSEIPIGARLHYAALHHVEGQDRESVPVDVSRQTVARLDKTGLDRRDPAVEV